MLIYNKFDQLQAIG